MSHHPLHQDIVAHLAYLAEQIGARAVGTPANLHVEKYIADFFRRECDLRVARQRFDFPQWASTGVALRVGDRAFTEASSIIANPFSPACDLRLPLVAVSTLRELGAATLTDKIVVLHGDLAKEPIVPQNFTIYMPEQHRAINDLLASKRPAAVIAITPRLHDPQGVLEDKDATIPSVTISAVAGTLLLRALATEPRLTAHLTITASRAAGEGHNVVATIPGQRPDKIVLCAHFDTKFGTPGAFDNGAGVSALMALGKELAKNRQRPQVGIELVAFNDEEYFALSDNAYMRDAGEALPAIIAAINIDGIGQWISTNTICLLSHSEAFNIAVEAIIAGYPGLIRVDPWIASNHYTFFSRGVPTIAFSSSGYAEVLHAADDTLALINPARIEQVADVILDLIAAFEDKSPGWSRPPVSAEVKT